MSKVFQTRRSFLRIAILGAGMLATACAAPATPAAPTAAPKPTEAPAATAAPEATMPAATTGRLAKIKAAGKFLYGLEAQYRPFEFRDKDNKIVGYDIDLADAIAAKWGVTAEPVDTNWSTVIETMYNDGFDLILGGMTATEKRFQKVNFSVPYMDAGSGIIVRAGEGITDRKTLDGKIVSAGTGTPSIDQLKTTADELSIKYKEDIKTFDDDAAAYEALKAKRVDAYASSVVSLNEFAKENPGFEVFPFKSDKWKAEWSVAAFRKEDEDLRTAFNEALLAMKKDGSLTKLQETAFGRSFETSDTPPTW